MPKLPVFGSRALEGACRDLGFDIDYQSGKGGHALAKHPTRNPSHGQRPFITIKGDREYGDPNFRSMLVREIMAFGYTRDEVIEAINNNL